MKFLQARVDQVHQNQANPAPRHNRPLARHSDNMSVSTDLLVSQPTAGTEGNVRDGLEETDSLPTPRRTGASDASENMTSGALSVRDRPFHSTKPKVAAVPTV
jgi:hypothetical protein